MRKTRVMRAWPGTDVGHIGPPFGVLYVNCKLLSRYLCEIWIPGQPLMSGPEAGFVCEGGNTDLTL